VNARESGALSILTSGDSRDDAALLPQTRERNNSGSCWKLLEDSSASEAYHVYFTSAIAPVRPAIRARESRCETLDVDIMSDLEISSRARVIPRGLSPRNEGAESCLKVACTGLTVRAYFLIAACHRSAPMAGNNRLTYDLLGPPSR